jgi:phosphate acetyltransferase
MLGYLLVSKYNKRSFKQKLHKLFFMNSIYILPLNQNCGSSVVGLGVMEILKKRFRKVAYFKPIIKGVNEFKLELMLKHFKLLQTKYQSFSFILHNIYSLSENLLLEKIINDYKELEKEYDFVLIDGFYFEEFIDFELNFEIAKNLNAPLLGVFDAKNKSKQEILEIIQFEKENATQKNTQYFDIIANKTSIKDNNFSSISYIKELTSPTLLEFEYEKLITNNLSKTFNNIKIAAMMVEHFLEFVEDDDLIITPYDRSDIILASLLSDKKISGIVISGNKNLPKNLHHILQHQKIDFPILKSPHDTFKTANEISNLKPLIHFQDTKKISLAIGAFFENINISLFESKLKQPSKQILTPLMFEYQLLHKAIMRKKRVVLPEGDDDRVLKACDILLRRNAVHLILLGDEEKILNRAKTLGLDIAKATIINPFNSQYLQEFAQKYFELRKHKNISLEMAKDLMLNPNYFGVMMVEFDLADGMVSGANHTTRETILPALQIIKKESLVSSFFFMCLEDRVLIYADCAINISPNEDELAQIAISSAKSAKIFGFKPKVALLSYSTKESGQGLEVQKIKKAFEIVKQKEPSLLIDAPLQYDAAIDKAVASKKAPNSTVAGEANVLVFPDLNSANNAYKAVQRSSNAVAIGPILQGL